MKNIYKKIIIMFVMVLGIMGIGAISNGYVANAATIGQQLVEPEDGWKRYDDADNRIVYENYQHEDNQKVNECYINDVNYYKNTRSYPEKIDSNIKIMFYGSKFRIISDKYHPYRTDNIKIIIDGKPEIINLTDNNVEKLETRVLQYESKNLNLGNHTIIIGGSDITAGKGFAFDAIDINNGELLSWVDQSISLDKSTLNLKEATSSKLTATTTPAGAEITWKSSDESVATVDSNGNVKAIKEGQVTITVQIKDTDVKATCVVTVTKEENPVEPDEPTDPDQEYIINTAYAKGDNTNNASGQVTIIFKGNAEAQLKVIKTADVDSVYVGDHFTYTIEVTNTSDKVAKSVVIKDSAPNHIQFIPNEVTATQGKVNSSSTDKNIVVNVGDIQPLGKVTIKIPVLVIE